jgi:hypothetical protein
MQDERSLTLRQINQARGDLCAIADDLDFLKAQLARVPTPKDLARMALLAMVGAAGLVILWMELLWRQGL